MLLLTISAVKSKTETFLKSIFLLKIIKKTPTFSYLRVYMGESAFKEEKQVDRQEAEKVITAYLKPIFGFALKRCKNIQDAEDLSQEIAAKAFRALLVKEDVADMRKFIWTVAHNALKNYYRDSAKHLVGVSIDEVAELVAAPCFQIDDDNTESLRRLCTEIAYLSKLQRKIVIAYYFKNRKQSDIAKELNIPLGTVKWHLFEAKKELKRGMNKMRNPSELKFNPIKFESCGVSGSVGEKSPDEFFRSALSQNICYCVRNTAKTINEIADDLGVSPVYVETEVEFLEEYDFLKVQKDKYITDFIISEPTAELLVMRDRMYKRAAELFANDLYDELISTGILDDPDIWCGQTDDPISLSGSFAADSNFILWSLIPYIAAWSGETLMDKRISFEEVATIRPDGGHNIYHATVLPDDLILPEDYVHMHNWHGPVWSEKGKEILWRIYSEWSDRSEHSRTQHSEEVEYVLSLYVKEREERLSKEEYAWLCEHGYVKTNGDYDGYFKAAWQIVILASKEIQTKLLDMGNRIKEKYKSEFDALKEPYVEAVLKTVPVHLRKIQEYELQSLFNFDGWFLLHCITALVNNGKLKLPTEGQRKSLTTIIVPNK